MKFKLILIVLLLTIFSPLASDGKAFIETRTSVTGIPSTLQAGSTIQLSSSIIDIGGMSVSQGDVTHYVMQEIHTWSGNQGAYSSTSPVTISVTGDLSVDGLRIPVSNSTQYFSSWWILKENGATIASGEIAAEDMKRTVFNESAIYIMFNSVQTATSSITLLSSRTYTLSFGNPGGVNFVSVGSSSASVDGVPVAFTLLQSNSVTKGRNVSLSMDVPGEFRIISYFWDDSDIFIASMSTSLVTVYAASDLEVQLQDHAMYRNIPISLVAQVLMYSLPLQDVEVTFSIYLWHKWERIGSSFSDFSGYAVYNYTSNIESGNYTIKAEASFAGQSYVAISNLQVKKKIATFYNLIASGKLGSGGDALSTQVEVSGQVIAETGENVQGATVFVNGDGVALSLITNQSGWISGYFISSKPIGNYNNYLTFSSNSSTYSISSVSVDMNILASSSRLNMPNKIYTEVGQNSTLTGTTTDQFGNDLLGYVELMKVEDGVQSFITSSNSTPSFTFNLESSTFALGKYYYIINFSPDSSNNPSSLSITLEITRNIAYFTRQGAGGTAENFTGTVDNPILYDHDQPISFEVRLLDDLIPVTGENIVFEVESYSSGQYFWEGVGTNITNADGIAVISFPLSMSYLNDQFSKIRVSLNSTNYNATSTTYYFLINKVTPQTNLLAGSYVVLDTEELRIEVKAESGEVVSGANLDVYLDGNYIGNYTTNFFGRISIFTTFDTAGLHTLMVGMRSDYYYYSAFSNNHTFTVNKKALAISTFDVNHISGEFLNYSGIVTDSSGKRVSGVQVVLSFGESQLAEQVSNSNGEITGVTSAKFEATLGIHYLTWSISETQLFFGTNSTSAVYVTSSLSQITANTTSYFYGTYGELNAVLRTQTPDKAGISGVVLNLAIPDVGYTSSLVTDSSGNAKFTLPGNIAPSTYLAIVSYSGNSTYLESNASSYFTVFGQDMSLEWVEQPQNIFYGEQLKMTFMVKDQFGQPMKWINVSVSYQNYSWILVTDNEGKVHFDRKVFSEGFNENITISVSSMEGYNDLIVDYPFTVRKSATTLLMDPIQYIGYGDILTFNATLIDERGDVVIGYYYQVFLVVNASYEVIIAEGTSLDGLVYYTVDTGQLGLPAETVWDIRIETFHAYYNPYTGGTQLVVNMEQLVVQILEYNITYYTPSTVKFVVTDDEGNFIPNLSISLFDYSNYSMVGLGQTDLNGQAVITIYPVHDGQHSFSYHIIDYDLNHAMLVGNFTVLPAKAEVGVTISQKGVNGTSFIRIRSFDATGNPLTTPMQLFYCPVELGCSDAEWIHLASFTVNGELYVPINQTTALLSYKLWVLETSTIRSSETFFDLRFYEVDYIVNNFSTNFGDYYDPNITFTQQPQIEFSISVYLNNGDLVGKVYIGSEVTSKIPIFLSVGDYQIHFAIINEPWVFGSNYSTTLRVSQEKIIVNEYNETFAVGRTTSYILSFTDDEGEYVWGDIYISTIINGFLHYFYPTEITDNHLYIFNITLDLDTPVGNYKAFVHASVNSNYEELSNEFTFFVRHSIEVIHEDPTFYFYLGLSWDIQIKDNVTDKWVEGLQILVFLSKDGERISDIVAKSTDSLGFAKFTKIFSEFDDAKLDGTDLKVFIIGNDVVESKTIEFKWGRNFTSELLPVDVEYAVVDGGITHQMKVYFWFSYKGTNITLTEAYDESDAEYLTYMMFLPGSGNNEPVSSEDLFLVEVNGTYMFVLDYNDPIKLELRASLTSTRFVATSEVSFIIGWDKTSANFSVEDQSVVVLNPYNNSIAIALTSPDGTPLSGIAVIATNHFGNEFLVVTDENGTVYLEFNTDLYPPNDNSYYIFTLRTADSSFLSVQTEVEISIRMERLDSPIGVSIPNAYIDETISVDIESNYNTSIVFRLFFNEELVLNGTANLYDIIPIVNSYTSKPGKYQLKVSRDDPFFKDNTEIVTFERLKIPVKIEYTILSSDNISSINLVFKDIRTDESYDGLEYNLSYYVGGVLHQERMSSSTIIIPNSATEITISLLGNYQGELKITLSSNSNNNQQFGFEINRNTIGLTIVVVTSLLFTLVKSRISRYED